MTNGDMTISFGPNNWPSFFVKYSSLALWREGIHSLHSKFLDQMIGLGFGVSKPETIARADLTFDYELPTIDFDEDNIVSLSTKDAKHRGNQMLQGLSFGTGDVVLRIYDKIKEIEQKSHKTWFFPIWGVSENVWRIEWQARKDVLRRFGIRAVDDLLASEGDLLRYLADEHDTLRIKSSDSNRSRWPLHGLWVDLQKQIGSLSYTGIVRDIDEGALLADRLNRIAISVYGYMKQAAAIQSIRFKWQDVMPMEALRALEKIMDEIHDPMSWEEDVNKRIAHLSLGPR